MLVMNICTYREQTRYMYLCIFADLCIFLLIISHRPKFKSFKISPLNATNKIHRRKITIQNCEQRWKIKQPFTAIVFHLSSQLILLHLEKFLFPKGPLFYQEHKLIIETIEVSGRSGIFRRRQPQGGQGQSFPRKLYGKIKKLGREVGPTLLSTPPQIRQ